MYDLIVIGAGPGGYVAAIRARQLGLKIALVEKRKTLGGTCLNVGCIPSKCLLQSTELYDTLASHSKEHGIESDNLSFSLSQMMSRKDAVVDSLTKGVAALIKKNKITFIEGEASFVDDQTIQVGAEEITAKNFLIATGSESIELPFLPFDEKRIVSSTGALELKAVPKKLLVVGGGVIGLELASVYRRLGSEVTIIEMMDTILPMMDKDVIKAFTKILAEMGITVLTKTKLLNKNLEIETGGKKSKLDADVILVGVGRKAYTKGLGLENVGIKTNDQGMIPVNGAFQTSKANIFAIGDVIDGPMLAHKASEEGIAAVEIIAGKKPLVNYLAIPNVIYTHPEVATVGMTESEAKEAGLMVNIGKSYIKGNARARCAGESQGFVKVIGDKGSGRLLGLHIVAPHASEMIGIGSMAIEKRVTVEEFAETPMAHPTISEAIKEAALATLGRVIHG